MNPVRSHARAKGASLKDLGGATSYGMKLLIATKNPGKAREIKTFLGNAFEVISLAELPGAPDVEETGKTFEENSLLKARSYFDGLVFLPWRTTVVWK